MTTDEELIAAVRVAHRSQIGFSDALMDVEDRLKALREEIRMLNIYLNVSEKAKNNWRDAYIYGT